MMFSFFSHRKSGLFLACLGTILLGDTLFLDRGLLCAAEQNQTSTKSECQERIRLLNKQIRQLENKKNSIDLSARIAEKDGLRLQFEDFLTSQMFYRRQKRLEAMSAALQQEIDALTLERDELEKKLK